MHADVRAVSVKREADDVTECSHDDLSTTTTGEFAAVSVCAVSSFVQLVLMNVFCL